MVRALLKGVQSSSRDAKKGEWQGLGTQQHLMGFYHGSDTMVLTLDYYVGLGNGYTFVGYKREVLVTPLWDDAHGAWHPGQHEHPTGSMRWARGRFGRGELSTYSHCY